MVTMRKKTVYGCPICGSIFLERKEAENCEAKGFPKMPWKIGDEVKVRNPSYQCHTVARVASYAVKPLSLLGISVHIVMMKLDRVVYIEDNGKITQRSEVGFGRLMEGSRSRGWDLRCDNCTDIKCAHCKHDPIDIVVAREKKAKKHRTVKR
jgi:hypothetical protein